MINRNKEMQDLVIKEAITLREQATQEELDNLNFSNLDGSHDHECIYGQMTGYCSSPRALSLILICATKVYKRGNQVDHIMHNNKLNGTPKTKRTEGLSYVSPIEVFIHEPENVNNSNNEALVGFLKGRTKTLKFV